MSEYRDLNASTPTQRPTITGVDSIYQSFDSIFNTIKGERAFNNTFGANLEDLLFEPLDEDTAALIEDIIFNAVEESEPRVSILFGNSSIIPNYDLDRYDITIYFQLLSLDSDIFQYLNNIPRKAKG